jgi:HK97 family phage prohead protease
MKPLPYLCDRSIFPKSAKLGLKLDTQCVLSSAATVAGRSSEALKIIGLVIPFGVPSDDLGGFRKVYEKGCFSASLNADLRVLFNHNPDFVLGRTTADTATFVERADGLYMEVEPPDVYFANALMVSIDRGDITDLDALCRDIKTRTDRGPDGKQLIVVQQASILEASVVSWSRFSSNRLGTTGPMSTAMHYQPVSEVAR